MKKAFLAVLLTFAAQVGWTDTKMSAFPSTTTLNTTDVIPVVTTPGGTPANKVITKANMFSNMGPVSATTFTVVGSTISLGGSGLTIGPQYFSGGINLVDGNSNAYPVLIRTNIVGDGASRQPLFLYATDGVGLGSTSECGSAIAASTAPWPNGGCPYVQVYPPTVSTTEVTSFGKYGSWGVRGSSANLQDTFSGFTSTNNVNESTLWSLPRKDGTSGQAMITDGLRHLSFGSVSSGSGSDLTVSSLTVSNATSANIALYMNSGIGTSTGKITSYENLAGIQQRGSIVFNDPSTGSINFYRDSTNSMLSLGVTGNAATFGLPVVVSTFTTAIANFSGPALSTFTYGVTAGSMTINGAGDGTITLTISGSTYTATVTSTTVGNTAFHMAGWAGANNQLIDIGLPIAPGGFGTINAGTAGLLSYYNIAGSTLSQVSGTLVTATSVTLPQTAFTSTVTFLVGGALSTNTPGSVDIWINNDTPGYTRPFTVGTLQHNDQIYLLDKTWFYSEYGMKTNSLQVGNATGGNTRIASIQSPNQFVDIYNSGEIDVQTAAFTEADIALKPKTIERFRVSFTTGIIAVGATANKWTLATSTNTSASYTDNDLQVTVSTNGALGYFGRSLAQLATIVPTKVFDTFGCSNCTTDAICVATQTVTASWARTSARTTACQ